MAVSCFLNSPNFCLSVLLQYGFHANSSSDLANYMHPLCCDQAAHEFMLLLIPILSKLHMQELTSTSVLLLPLLVRC